MNELSDSPRWVCVSGVHGAGKTTLVNAIADTNILKWARPILAPNHDPFLRASARIDFYIHELSHNDPSRPAILDRCLYDSIAYIIAYHRLGMISNEQRSDLLSLANLRTVKAGVPKIFIYMRPPINVIWDRLQARKLVNDRRPMDENFQFLNSLYLAYDKIFLERLFIRSCSRIIILSDIDVTENIRIARCFLKDMGFA